MTHQLDRVVDGIVGCDRVQLVRADLTDEHGSGVASVGDRPNDDVAIGEDPADDAVAQYEDVAHIDISHRERGFLHGRGIAQGDRVRGHDVSDLLAGVMEQFRHDAS